MNNKNKDKHNKKEKLDVYKLLGGGGFNPFFYYNPYFRQFADNINRLFECLTIANNGHIVILDNKGNLVLDINELLQQGGEGIGPQGSKGEKGDIGATGPQGSKGEKGDIGATGPQGVQGVQGIWGISGAQGAQGAKGAQGIAGEAAAQGAQGAQGRYGISGAQGAQGAKGAQGIAGEAAAQGAQGAQGRYGISGDTGAQGPQGPQGIAGEAAAQGAQGAQGLWGIKGDTGVQGPQGPQGSKGEKGEKGDSFDKDPFDGLLPPNDEIWYISTDESIIEPNTSGWKQNILSNTYQNGKGIIKFDNALTIIPNNAFKEKIKLQYIKFANNFITSIGQDSFKSCRNLLFISIPESVQTIKSWAFCECCKLNNIVIPNNVVTLEKGVFMLCSSLKTVIIGKNVNTIEAECFLSCPNLINITVLATVPPSLPYYGDTTIGYNRATAINSPDYSPGKKLPRISVDPSCLICVPNSSLEDYSQTEWNVWLPSVRTQSGTLVTSNRNLVSIIE